MRPVSLTVRSGMSAGISSTGGAARESRAARWAASVTRMAMPRRPTRESSTKPNHQRAVSISISMIWAITPARPSPSSRPPRAEAAVKVGPIMPGSSLAILRATSRMKYQCSLPISRNAPSRRRRKPCQSAPQTSICSRSRPSIHWSAESQISRMAAVWSAKSLLRHWRTVEDGTGRTACLSAPAPCGRGPGSSTPTPRPR